MLCEDLTSILSGRVAVVGVGNEDRGDDGAGPLVVRMLADAGIEHVIDSGTSPEIDTWRLRELMPDSVLFVDAVDFGGRPGDAALLPPGDMRKTALDTHRAALSITMEYLQSELKCRCFLLAVQPKRADYGAPMSDEVRRSAARIAEIVGQVIGPARNSSGQG